MSLRDLRPPEGRVEYLRVELVDQEKGIWEAGWKSASEEIVGTGKTRQKAMQDLLDKLENSRVSPKYHQLNNLTISS